MKKKLFLFALLFSSFSPFFGAIDPADSSTYYNVENWYARRNDATPKISATDSSITISTLSKDAYVWLYFAPTTLKIGQSLTFSGIANFGEVYADGKFTFGLFDSKNIDVGENALKGTTTITGGMEGLFTDANKAYLKLGKTTQYGALSSQSSGDASLSSSSYASPLASTFVVGVDYDFSFLILKTENGYDVSSAIGAGEKQSVSIISDTTLDTFDTFMLKQVAKSVTFSNLAIAIIPEPSLFGAFVGVFALALCAMRRRRKSKLYR